MSALLTSWGKYPRIEAEVIQARQYSELSQLLSQNTVSGIPRGNGRSYGDSALAPCVFSSLHLNHFLHFDETAGILSCGAGVRLDEILDLIVPRGWFLSVTPGTQFVSIGGAIASDVHGKNHHLEGCFSESLVDFKLMLASGEIVNCSPNENTELFRATCGGMGLTGMILEATFRLKKIPSAFIRETTLKAKNLEEALHGLDGNSSSTYSVAWIDCLSEGKDRGRSLIMLGEHAEDFPLHLNLKKPLNVPIEMPNFLLSASNIRTFNALYYRRARKIASERIVHYEPYFYPLDRMLNWNRLYGKNGFTQYQFVIPREGALAGLEKVLQKTSLAGRGSFLAVLKAFGKENQNYLSFPKEGYTLALDFKMDAGIFDFLNELDAIILDHGGRLYLTKDVRMSAQTFRQGYPHWEKFAQLREKYGANKVFQSLQSKRLEII